MTKRRLIADAASHPDVAQGGSDGWCSPRDVTSPLEDFFGGPVDCDPCSNERSLVNARVAYTFGGLHFPWGKKTYENCPFSKTLTWTNKGISEMKAGRVVELVRLTMVATSTQWWVAMTKAKRNPRFLFTKRLKFVGEAQTQNMGARFDTVLTYFGPNAKRFDKHFRHLERWSTWGR